MIFSIVDIIAAIPNKSKQYLWIPNNLNTSRFYVYNMWLYYRLPMIVSIILHIDI